MKFNGREMIDEFGRQMELRILETTKKHGSTKDKIRYEQISAFCCRLGMQWADNAVATLKSSEGQNEGEVRLKLKQLCDKAISLFENFLSGKEGTSDA